MDFSITFFQFNYAVHPAILIYMNHYHLIKLLESNKHSIRHEIVCGTLLGMMKANTNLSSECLLRYCSGHTENNMEIITRKGRSGGEYSKQLNHRKPRRCIAFTTENYVNGNWMLHVRRVFDKFNSLFLNENIDNIL